MIPYWEPENLICKQQLFGVSRTEEIGQLIIRSIEGIGRHIYQETIILRYSNIGGCILDQFLGSGTTLVEAKLLKRRGVGIDINSEALKIAESNLNFKIRDSFEPKILHGDARKLETIQDNSIELICTHPPYANIIKYSQDNDKGLRPYFF